MEERRFDLGTVAPTESLEALVGRLPEGFTARKELEAGLRELEGLRKVRKAESIAIGERMLWSAKRSRLERELEALRAKTAEFITLPSDGGSKVFCRQDIAAVVPDGDSGAWVTGQSRHRRSQDRPIRRLAMDEKLIAFLEEVELAASKCSGEASAFYSADGDCVLFHAENVEYFAERVDGLLTVFRSLDDRRIVGLQVKGVRKRADAVVAQIDNGPPQLVRLLFVSFANSPRQADPNVLSRYSEAATRFGAVTVHGLDLSAA